MPVAPVLTPVLVYTSVFSRCQGPNRKNWKTFWNHANVGIKLKMSTKLAVLNSKYLEPVELLSAWSYVLVSSRAIVPPSNAGDRGFRPAPSLFDSGCISRTSKHTVPHLLGLEVFLTWVQVLGLQLNNCKILGDSLPFWGSLFLCVNEYVCVNSHRKGKWDEKEMSALLIS